MNGIVCGTCHESAIGFVTDSTTAVFCRKCGRMEENRSLYVALQKLAQPPFIAAAVGEPAGVPATGG